MHIDLGAIPTHKDYVIGHEPMGIVEKVGPNVTKVKKGDRVVIPFNLACGHCFYCDNEMESQCDNSNPNPHVDTGGYLGFTERYGNYPGGQAEIYVFLMATLHRLSSLKHVSFPMKPFFSCRTSCRQLIGA